MSTLGHAIFLSMLSYLCEAGFLTVALIKSKHNLEISVVQEMMLAVSDLIPRFEMLHSARQSHISK